MPPDLSPLCAVLEALMCAPLPSPAFPPLLFAQSLSGSIPDTSRLPQLQALLLHNNHLTGSLPDMPAAMRNIHLEFNSLRWVWLWRCCLCLRWLPSAGTDCLAASCCCLSWVAAWLVGCC
jgi:hypothetical protein